jgi:hypothetical protein
LVPAPKAAAAVSALLVDGAQVREDGKDPAVVLAAFVEIELEQDRPAGLDDQREPERGHGAYQGDPAVLAAAITAFVDAVMRR